MPESLRQWLSDWLVRPGIARLKGRFGAGKASFLSAGIASTQNLPEQGRLFSHYRLATGPVLQGAAGLSALRERLGKAGELIACLRCADCGHEYVVAVESADDPLGLPLAPGGGAGYPASFTTRWFRFWHPRCPGEPSLDCPHCEQRGRPRFRFLR